MIFDRHACKAGPPSADRFLASQAGVLLHELGHYVAANTECVVVGHIVLTDHSGAFRPLDGMASLSSGQLAFVCAAGALAEQHFCQTILHRRLGSDLARYVTIRPPSDPETRVIDIIEEWKRDYAGRMAALAACIEANFERCMDFVAGRRFLIDGLHVIPSAVLQLPHRRTLARWFSERRATMGMVSRRHVITLCTGDRVLRSTSESSVAAGRAKNLRS